eukprot:GGOE01019341.1.p1 GENE.GGOE01019341.1~~GGOE01019341.1.p1  ORF type:complete len:863 (+),score=278.77 GGOE01019341.1:150-2591(+)
MREDELGRRIHNASTPRRSSFGKPSGTSRYIAVGGLPGATLAQVRPLSATELESLHRSCMEMNQSNRITAQNSWNLKLIDYLQEVMNSSLSQNQNFQVASVTIECSVKIYSSRVDSLESESLRVVGSLHRSDAPAEAERREENAPREPPARRAHHAATLESNADNLDVRNVEAQFDVDPLFRITCSKFDAGGAAGLLLNNIRIGPYCQLMLDSSIIPANGEIEEEELWGGLNAKAAATTSGDAGGAEGEDDDVNEAELRGPGSSPAQEPASPPHAGAPIVEETLMVEDDACAADPDTAASYVPETQEPPAEAEGLAGEEGGSDGGDFNDGPDGSIDEEMDGATTPPLTSSMPAASLASEALPAEPEVGAEALLPALDIEAIILEKNADEIANLVGEGNDFSYFNRELVAPLDALKAADEDELSDCDSELGNMAPTQQGSWTGMTGHWKFRTQREPAAGDTKPKVKEERKKKTRESSRIDFTKPLTEKELKAFQPPADPYSTMLAIGRERAKAAAGKITGEKARRILTLVAKGTDPKAMLNRAKRKCLYLPDDTHFDMDSLFQPFTRSGPEWNLKLRALRKKQPSGPALPHGSSPVPPIGTGAPAAGGLADFDGFAPPQPINALPELEGEGALPDVYSDAGGGGDNEEGDDGFDPDDSLNMTHAGEGLLPPPDPAVRISNASQAGAPPTQDMTLDGAGGVELVQMPQHVNAIKVNYSKVAKQIDIKRLKDCMWNRICDMLAEDNTSSRKRKSTSQLKFTDLILSMAQDVRLLGNPEEITVSFYFISLLHLANEKGLELQGLPCLSDLFISFPAV